jgi:hypothetical protein
MKKSIWLGLLLITVVTVSAVWFLSGQMNPSSEEGFRLVSLENNSLLISDADVVSYNCTSQEITIVEAASQRLQRMGDDLYSFTDGFIIRIDGEEVYRGVFRTAFMSAIPEPPNISILFPSMVFPSETENYSAIRMFFPWFEPPSDQSEANARFSQYFEQLVN